MIQRQDVRTLDTPPYADFPRAEYETRVSRAKAAMAEAKIDLLVLWDGANIQYFTGFTSQHFRVASIAPGLCLLPLEGDPILMVPDFFVGTAEALSYVDDIRLMVDPHITNNIRALPGEVASIIAELGLERGTIGLETSREGMMAIPRPLCDIDSFRQSLPGATFVDAAGSVLWPCRMVKSPAEVEALREASMAVVQAYGDLVSGFRLGMTEYDISALVRDACLRYTDDCLPPNVRSCSRPVSMPDTPAMKHIVLRPGDSLLCEPLPTRKGYYGSCARIWRIGPLTDAQLEKAEAVDRAQAEAFRAARPGVRVTELVDAITESLAQAGMEFPGDGMAGHGVGLGMQEPPMVAREEDGVLQEGMVIAIEVWEVDRKAASAGSGTQFDFYGNEDLGVVTKTGVDLLPSFPKDIRSLPV